MAGKDTVVCRFKNPLVIKLNPHDNLKSGCSVIEVSFPHLKPLELGKIQFSNNYTGYLTIKAQFKETNSEKGTGSANPRKWITLIKNKQLMPNIHYDICGQDDFIIKREEMLEKPDNILYMRFILRQPSPTWLQFSIENIKLIPKVDTEIATEEVNYNLRMPSINASKTIASSAYPDPAKVATSLQNLWALMYSRQTGAPPPFLKKLEVDGSYDVSTLSYS